MKEELISLEVAKLAKEKGFNIPIMQANQVYCTITEKIETVIESNAVKN